jgi:hypothetical protein
MSVFGDILDDAAEAFVRGELKGVADSLVVKGDLPADKEQEMIDGVIDAVAAGLKMWRQSQAPAPSAT